ncbi:hypothetical protein SKAU_G00403750 [Synaphobranchus kaupii]|uniref:Uncharacterized protein n=1 Tax=Synaphobranchus kaupii TaxID=118154 RepID=A0A9Q1E9L3_SYNKA|nr:hypothetical protein SKAU_G00403750 [Synaphobranchus kaupii]
MYDRQRLLVIRDSFVDFHGRDFGERILPRPWFAQIPAELLQPRLGATHRRKRAGAAVKRRIARRALPSYLVYVTSTSEPLTCRSIHRRYPGSGCAFLWPTSCGTAQSVSFAEGPRPRITTGCRGNSSSAQHSVVRLEQPWAQYCVGDTLNVLVEMRNYAGHPKAYDGGFILAWIHSPNLKACTAAIFSSCLLQGGFAFSLAFSK